MSNAGTSGEPREGTFPTNVDQVYHGRTRQLKSLHWPRKPKGRLWTCTVYLASKSGWF